MELKEYDSVRIGRLLVPERNYIGTDRVARPPHPGDTGIVVAISGRGADRTWVVESVTPEGETVWLADFHAEELEKIQDDSDEGPAEPGLATYLVGVLLGAGAAYAVAFCWFGLAPPWLTLVVGAVAALYGIFSLGTLIEAAVLSMLLGAVAAVLIAVLPGLGFLKALAAAGACGLTVGNIVVGLRREVFP